MDSEPTSSVSEPAADQLPNSITPSEYLEYVQNSLISSSGNAVAYNLLMRAEMVMQQSIGDGWAYDLAYAPGSALQEYIKTHCSSGRSTS